MILAVCLNPAIDLTYRLPRLVPGASHAVRAVGERAGGKAVNTARILAQLSVDVTLCGLVGGDRGARLRSLLAATSVKDALTPLGGETRQSVAVVDDGDATVFNEPGPRIGPEGWASLLGDYATVLAAGAEAVVVSGSVPVGVPDDAYRQLVALAHQHGVPAVLDATGPQLLNALDARPAVLAPNHTEVADTLSTPLDDVDDLLEAAATLSSRTGGVAVVSAGARGLVAVSPQGRWRGEPPRAVQGNPTGAGDALTAALARGLAEQRPLPDVLADGLALAAAAVARPVAGEVDLATYHELRPRCEVHDLP